MPITGFAPREKKQKKKQKEEAGQKEEETVDASNEARFAYRMLVESGGELVSRTAAAGRPTSIGFLGNIRHHSHSGKKKKRRGEK